MTLTYPVFEAGQTLTKTDLNELRAFLDDQASVLGRLVGFGIACGLDGTLKGTLVIEPGLAIDQEGHPALLADRVRIEADAAATERFEFLDEAAGGVTPVLVVRDVREPAPECTDGCRAHAAMVERQVTVVLGRGRLKDAEIDFANEPLLKLEPLTVSEKSVVGGAFVKIKNTVLQRLQQEGFTLSAAATARLSELALDSTKIAAINVYRAAFLNQVMFATLELLRCKALHDGDCLRDTATPGVALGWLSIQGGKPAWDCSYRHSFEPAEGLAMALVGGTACDPCDMFLDYLEALVAAYDEPDVPPPGGGGSGGGGFHVCPKGSIWRPGQADFCLSVVTPPKQFKETWRDRFIPKGRPPFVDKSDWVKQHVRPEDVYEIPDLDFGGFGTVQLGPAWGRRGEDMAAKLREQVGQYVGSTPEVRVVTTAQAAQMQGFEPQSVVGAGDVMVLGVDESERVVVTGRVAAQRTLQQVTKTVTAVADAVAAAGEAKQLAADAATFVRDAESTLAAVRDLAPQLQQMQALTAQVQGLFGDKGTLATMRKDLRDEMREEMRITTEVLHRNILLVATGAPVPVKDKLPMQQDLAQAMAALVEGVKSAPRTVKQRQAVERVLEEHATPIRKVTESTSGTFLTAGDAAAAMDGILAAVLAAGAKGEAVDVARERIDRIMHRPDA